MTTAMQNFASTVKQVMHLQEVLTRSVKQVLSFWKVQMLQDAQGGAFQY